MLPRPNVLTQVPGQLWGATEVIRIRECLTPSGIVQPRGQEHWLQDQSPLSPSPKAAAIG